MTDKSSRLQHYWSIYTAKILMEKKYYTFHNFDLSARFSTLTTLPSLSNSKMNSSSGKLAYVTPVTLTQDPKVQRQYSQSKDVLMDLALPQSVDQSCWPAAGPEVSSKIAFHACLTPPVSVLDSSWV
jgi:hypothetical protein